MKILLLESFYTSSHRKWADGLKRHSAHAIEILSLPGRHWKWRMHHAGVHFAQEVTQLDDSFDLILCSDLMNVAEFRGLLSSVGNRKAWYTRVPIVTYFHENQITYPWSKDDPDLKLKRDNHYGWINYVSCLASDHILFNSSFHKNSFLNALPPFLQQFPDQKSIMSSHDISAKSSVLRIGLELEILVNAVQKKNEIPVILWNHRWEYDKNPELFFETLLELADDQYDFELIVAGEAYKKYPKIFDTAKERLSDKIIHFGYVHSQNEYHNLLLRSDIVPVTSKQDFFGISAVEAIAAGCIPLLPQRLAFPEHLTQDKHHCYYYRSRSEFKRMLIHALSLTKKDTIDLRKHILKYDWKNVGPKYDRFFQAMTSAT